MLPAEPLALALVICTFQRPHLLAAALASVSAQPVVPGLQLTVYVVDNSDDGSARSVTLAQASTSPFEIRWIEAHPPNISVARNAGIKASSEACVAFIDDDETCAPGWLAAIELALRTCPHDAFLGRVDSAFEAPGLATPAIRQLFSRQLDMAAGHDLFAYGPQKHPGISLATNNTVFRRATALSDDPPFDPAYGHGGGEDYDLFCRLQRRGRRFAWLPDAVVHEFVPRARCDDLYLWRRFYTGGQVYAAVMARNSARPGPIRWGLRLRALVQAVALLAQVPLALSGGHDARRDYRFRWAGVWGKLSFGDIYPIYRRHGP